MLWMPALMHSAGHLGLSPSLAGILSSWLPVFRSGCFKVMICIILSQWRLELRRPVPPMRLKQGTH